MPDSPDVVLVVRSGCHLCDEARALVSLECARAGTTYREVDVADDAALAQRFGELVPVLLVAGRIVDYWRLDPVRTRRAIEGVA